MDPRNTYAASKVTQEHLGGIWARESGGCAISLRLHNVYGPGMPRNTAYAGVASIFCSALTQGVAPRVFEDGGQRRDLHPCRRRRPRILIRAQRSDRPRRHQRRGR